MGLLRLGAFPRAVSIMRSMRTLLALAVAGSSSTVLARSASDRAVSLHWNRASRRIIHDAQEKIALVQADLQYDAGVSA
jgi:hypothetical protein